ncbi:MAG: hypothetical protein WBA23_00800 [Tunicatimonas sp.]|uniref:hypothetical protein n=1 Tax=Tunicatimonas sp. TaxID=1940096 RepID=UPI003C7857C1
MNQPPRIQTKTYAQALALAKDHLLELSQHQVIKHWALEHNINYTSIVKIKNGNLTKFSPLLISKILTFLGYEVLLTRDYLDDQPAAKSVYYIIKRIAPKKP